MGKGRRYCPPRERSLAGAESPPPPGSEFGRFVSELTPDVGARIGRSGAAEQLSPGAAAVTHQVARAVGS